MYFEYCPHIPFPSPPSPLASPLSPLPFPLSPLSNPTPAPPPLRTSSSVLPVLAKIKTDEPVWLRAPKGSAELFLPAKVTNVQQAGARVTVETPNGASEVLDRNKADVFPANPTGTTAPDHCALIHLNEPCILENTRLRYNADAIYTYTGKILVALNPFGPLKIYGEETMQHYLDKEIGARGVGPHVYAMGEAAYKHVRRAKSPASLIMSGESGAGKTETTKHLMRYLAWRSEKAGAEGKLTKLADAILSTNPLLEAFGNAKTVRNNNSSRFGKMMRLHFDPKGTVSGAEIKTYLLEKSRSVAISDPERNYHVFYQLMAGASASTKGKMLSTLSVDKLHMLNQSKCHSLVGVDDGKAHKETIESMNRLGVSAQLQEELYQILSALLLLGNLTFTSEDDKAKITDGGESLAAAEELLGAGSLAKNLTTRTMQRGGGGKRQSVYTIDFNKGQAEMARDAVVKSIYTHLFDWVVSNVNANIGGEEASKTHPYVGLLDIFGFENFKFNSFEQLCINFANEKLQQFFLVCVFKTEEELHVKEGVPWRDIEFQDNAPCIELLEKPPNGILRLLDSQCKTPNATEASFCKELNRLHGKGEFIVPTRQARMRDEEGFIVRHYAGDVIYHSSAVVTEKTGHAEVPWLEKNNDTLQQEWLALLVASKVSLVKELFLEEFEAAQKAKKTASFSSIGKRFVTDLNSLLTELQASRASFIRCVKPNADQSPRKFTGAMVLDQLRCSGVIEAVRVMLEAFPTRIPYEDIHGRYASMMGKEIMEETGDEPAAFCEAVALACEVSASDYALGLTKLFLKAGCGTFLEDLASMDVAVVVPLLTAKIAESKRKKGAQQLLANYVLMWFRRKKFKDQKRAIAVAQHKLRSIKARRDYQKWSVERQARLKAEAAERAKEEAIRRAKQEAEEKLRKEQEEEMAKTRAAEQEAKKKEQAAAMAKAMEDAKTEAEARMAREMDEAVRKAEQMIEESAQRERSKLQVDMQRTDYQAKASDQPWKEHQTRLSMTTVSEEPQPASGGQPAEVALDTPPPGGDDAADDELGSASTSKAASSKVLKEEFFDVTIVRDLPGGTLGIAVDLWDGEVTVGAITTDGPADREGTLIQGDIIRAVEGVVCGTIEEVTQMVIKGQKSLTLSICRRPVTTVLESKLLMKMPSGEWEPFAFRLLSNRNIEYEKLSPPLFSGEIHARLAHSLKLASDNEDKVLEIETGHKTFQIKAHSRVELAQWHLRLQEVIMLQEKVANVAHGWLLKEETGAAGGKTQLKHYWFVLFSNGILMHFSDPNRAVLGQSLGFIPVEHCAESSQSMKQHTLLVKCSFDSWLLATNSKENMLQWAASLHAAQPSKQTVKQAVDLVLAQGWLDLPKQEEATGEEVWVRHWFVLKNSQLTMFTEEQKRKGELTQPVVALAVADMLSATRAKGVEFYKWGIQLDTVDGAHIRMRAVGQSEMRQLLSTLNVHCIVASNVEEEKPMAKTKQTVRSGWIFKKSEKKAGVRTGKAWQRRWFVLEIITEAGKDGTQVRTGKLTYYHTPRDASSSPQEGVEIPLHETMGVRGGIGKTKGTEHRITLQTPQRDWELGSPEEKIAKDWIEQLQQWVGLPKVERLRGESVSTGARLVKAQWMECRVEVFKPEEISDEELARSNTMQKTVSSFSRTFTLTGRKKKEESPDVPDGAAKEEGGEEEGEEGEDDELFNWVYVALMSDHTLRQFENEDMATELGQLKLGYLVQCAFLDDPPDATYEHAFRVKPDGAVADSWVLCPDTRNDSLEWMTVLKA
ncbi:hypothetical protein AB1Y20_022751 [Prymnesium parvum]|uniref:Calmodulin n=1 Tax=Prymnesium parvum TaxID=97485 RepID=A0AB34JKJ9_PRYPA